MLEIVLPSAEYWDETNQMFVEYESETLQLEHSLATVSKWESKWEIPFLTREEKTQEQILSYIEMMSVSKLPENIFSRLNQDHFTAINEFINSKRSATWFADDKQKKIAGRSTEIITSELIYYWMVAFNIPFECQHWHLFRLMTLIRVCNAKLNQDNKQQKMSKQDLAARNRELNAKRRAQFNTKG